jgi:hypothetical protein
MHERECDHRSALICDDYRIAPKGIYEQPQDAPQPIYHTLFLLTKSFRRSEESETFMHAQTLSSTLPWRKAFTS